jgi:hypothetical protein
LPFTAWIAAAATHTSKKVWIPIILVCLSVLSTFSYTRGAIYVPRNDAYYSSRQNFTDGTSSMGNSLSTMWTPWKETRYDSMVTDVLEQPVSSKKVREQYLDKIYTINLTTQTLIRFHVLYFPGWHAYIDGKEVAIMYTNNGTVDIAVPAGDHVVRIFMTETPIRMIADIVSVLSLGILCGFGILTYRKRTHIQK